MAPNTTRRAGNSRRPRRLGPYHAPTLVSSFVAPGRGRTALPGILRTILKGLLPPVVRKVAVGEFFLMIHGRWCYYGRKDSGPSSCADGGSFDKTPAALMCRCTSFS